MLMLCFIITKLAGVLALNWWWLFAALFIDMMYLQTAKEYYIEKYTKKSNSTFIEEEWRRRHEDKN